MSKKTSNQILAYGKRSLKFIEKDIIKNYNIALKDIRNELLLLDEKGQLTQTEVIKYNRLTTLQDSINSNLNDISNNTYKSINTARENNFENAYNKTLGEVDIVFGKVNKDFVRKSLENPLYKANFKDDLSKSTKSSAKKISGEITQGLIQGKSISEISKRIKNLVNNDAKKSITIARTETLRAMSQGQLEATDRLIERGFIVKKIWSYSYHIKGSRPEHEALDGQSADDDGLFRYYSNSANMEIAMPAPRTSGIASEDINCRCAYYNEIIEE